MSKHYVKEYFGEGTIGGDQGFYLKDIQDGAGVTIKRGDLVEYPELWPAPKFPTAIITDIFRYKSGEKVNKNKIEVQFENGDKSEMRPNEVFKRDVEAEEAHREHVIQDIKSELHKNKPRINGISGTRFTSSRTIPRKEPCTIGDPTNTF